jgi:hypothetical protein
MVLRNNVGDVCDPSDDKVGARRSELRARAEPREHSAAHCARALGHGDIAGGVAHIKHVFWIEINVPHCTGWKGGEWGE